MSASIRRLSTNVLFPGGLVALRRICDSRFRRLDDACDTTDCSEDSMSTSVAEGPIDPRRYFESIERDRTEIADRDPVCLYLETTNRCNLPCTTCPRTFEELEPAANMSWDMFRSLVDQYPDLARVGVD